MTAATRSMSTFGTLRRAVTEAPIIVHRLWVVLLLNMGGTAVQVLIPVIVQQTLDRYVSGGGTVDIGGVAVAVGIGLVVVVVGGLMTRAALVRLISQACCHHGLLRMGPQMSLLVEWDRELLIFSINIR